MEPGHEAGHHAICSSNGDPHAVTFDGKRFDFYKIGDWAMVMNDRRDFQVCCFPYNVTLFFGFRSTFPPEDSSMFGFNGFKSLK